MTKHEKKMRQAQHILESVHREVIADLGLSEGQVQAICSRLVDARFLISQACSDLKPMIQPNN